MAESLDKESLDKEEFEKKVEAYSKAVDRVYELKTAYPEAWAAYEHQQKAIMDFNSLNQQYYEEGFEKGVKKGLQESIQELRIACAQRLLKRGMDKKKIAKITELDLDIVQSLSE